MKPAVVHGMFFALGPRVYLNSKIQGVVRIQVYSSIEPEMRMVYTNSDMYVMNEGEILEVTYHNHKGLPERRFFKYSNRMGYVELFFREKNEEEDGEEVILKHFGLLGKTYSNGLIEYLLEKH